MSDRWQLSVFADEIDPSLEAQIQALHDNKVGHIEFRSAWGKNVLDLDQEELDRAARLLKEGGIRISAIGSPLGKAPIDGDFAEEQDRLRRALHAAEVLETPMIRIFSFYVEGRYEERRDEVVRRLAAMTEEAARAGRVLVHENESYIFGDLPERCRDILASVDSPHLRAAFDPANFVQCGVQPMRDAWPLLEPYVTHVHIKDAVPVDRTDQEPYPARVPEYLLMPTVRPAGQGEGQLPELLSKLAANGYEGILTIEPHLAFHLPEMDGAGRFRVAVEALRQLVAEVGP